MNIVPEEWRSIEGLEGYEVSNLGSVRSLDRTTTNSRGVVRRLKGRVLQLTNHPQGYLTVRFYGRIPQLVHRIVAAAWIGDAPAKHDVNHIDGNKKNNAASNLEYVTRKGNMEHAQRTGLWDNRGQENGQAKYSEEQIRVANALVLGGSSQKDAARRVGMSPHALCKARLGVKWAHLGISGTRLKQPAPLKQEMRDEVRRLHLSGASQKEIQELTGVSKGSIHRIIHAHRTRAVA